MENYNPKEYPPFAVTVDLGIFTIRDGQLQVLLVERGGPPFEGSWALPGGFVNPSESAEEAAVRELAEETGINFNVLNNIRARIIFDKDQVKVDDKKKVHLEQLKTYSSPDRDPRMRVVSVAFVALAAELPDPVAGDDARNARWWPVEDLLAEVPEIELAFDHSEIVKDALERVRSKLEYTTLATQFVKEPFTLSDLWRVYKIVWGEEPHLQNFRRKVLSIDGFVEQVDGFSEGNTGPKAKLYKAGNTKEIQPAMMRMKR